MAEIRKHNPKTSLIGRIVRAAAGDPVRPAEPGQGAEGGDGTPGERPSPTLRVTTAAGSPLIGVLPNSARGWAIIPPTKGAPAVDPRFVTAVPTDQVSDSAWQDEELSGTGQVEDESDQDDGDDYLRKFDYDMLLLYDNDTD